MYVESSCLSGGCCLHQHGEQLSKSKEKPVIAARDSFPCPGDIFSPGTTIDNRFRIIARLSKGPRGQVYVAEHTILEERLAIRVLYDSSELGDDIEDRFLEEAKTLARLNHKNIVKLFDAGVTSQGFLFFTMELIEGLSLDKWRANKNDPDFDTPDDARFLDALLVYMRQVVDGVMECHEIGVYHHNLKPSNIYLTETERSSAFVRIPKIIDFGHIKKRAIGHRLHRDEAYLAPELRAGESSDGRADIFSLGVIFYEMLTGKLPHEDIKTFDHATIDTLVVPPSVRNPYVPAKLDALVMKAIAWQPDDRHASMFDFVEVFDAALVLHRTRVTTDVDISLGMVAPERENHFIKFGLILLSLVIAGTAFVGGVIINRLGNESTQRTSIVADSTPPVRPILKEMSVGSPDNQNISAPNQMVLDAGNTTETDALSSAPDSENKMAAAEISDETLVAQLLESSSVEVSDAIAENLAMYREVRGKKNHKEVQRLIDNAGRSMGRQNWDAARDLFQSAIISNPRRADAWAGLSRIYYQMESLDKAVKYMKKALSLRNKPAWRMQLGEYLDRRGDRAAAIETWQSILSDFPRAKQSVKNGVRKNLKKAGAL